MAAAHVVERHLSFACAGEADVEIGAIVGDFLVTLYAFRLRHLVYGPHFQRDLAGLAGVEVRVGDVVEDRQISFQAESSMFFAVIHELEY